MATAPTRQSGDTASVNQYVFTRMVAFVVAGIVGVLVLGSISQRLISADQAWVYLALGGVLGLLVGGIVPILQFIPDARRYLSTPLFFLAGFLICLVALVAVRLVGVDVSLSWTGVVFGSFIVASAGVFLYCLLDSQHG